jgi:putative endonuclease
MDSTRDKGNYGEDLAAEYLEEKGYKIRKRNFYFGKTGEIDIIAEKDGELVFIEVKYRTNRSFGEPLESITPKKANTLRRTAEGYLYVNDIYDQACRIDIIVIDKRGNKPQIQHIENGIF